MARLLDEVIGHKKVIQSWLHDLKANRLHHAHLLAGPPGVGKKKLARAFAQILLCERDQTGCGECPSCHRVAEGVHESMFFIPEAHGNIKVETAHEIREFLSLKKLSKARVLIFERADLFLPAAANMILKTLEEPPEDTYFFLLAPSAFHLLPTIRSRLVTLRLSPLSIDEMKSHVQAPEWAIVASRGRFDRLENFRNEELKVERDDQAGLLHSIMFDKDWLLTDWRKEVPAREHIQPMLEFWLSLIRDLLVLQTGDKKHIVNPDQSQFFTASKAAPKNNLDRAIKIILQFMAQAQTPRDLVLLLEEFYLRLHAEEVTHVV